MGDVKNMIVWQKSMDLCESVYAATKRFPTYELHGLTSQMRRCSVSIPSNIAEGHGRGTRREYRQFLRIARGSACELETQVLLSARLGHMTECDAEAIVARTREVLRMINGLLRAISADT